MKNRSENNAQVKIGSGGSRKLLRALVLAAVAAALFACGNPAGDNGPGNGTAVKITVASQSGILVAGTVGNATFAVTTANLADEASCSITWFQDASGANRIDPPAGLSAQVTPVSHNAALVTVDMDASAAAGSYYFRLFDGVSLYSNVATLTIGAAGNVDPVVASVSLGAQSGTIAAGSAGSATFSATTQNVAAGTTGTIVWSSGSAPAGIVTAFMSPVYGGTATVTIYANAQTVAGSYYFHLLVAGAVSNTVALTINAAPVVASVSLGAQNGTINAGSAGSATFTATTQNVAAGTAGTITWSSGSAPLGISSEVSQVSGGAATVTMTANAAAVAGNYQFTLREGTVSSNAATLTISAALPPTLTLGSQVGDITSGTVGSATYELQTEHLADAAACTFSWYTSPDGSNASFLARLPFGITASMTPITGGSSTITVDADVGALEGTWYFRVTYDYMYSSGIVKFTVQRAPAPALTMMPVEGGTFHNGFGSVTLSSYYISKHEITQELYESVMGSNPSDASGAGIRLAPAYPVNNVSWYAALAFCNRLSIKEGRTPVYTISGSKNPANWGPIPTSQTAAWDAVTQNLSASGYRLPTEAEWEFAAIGGVSSMNYKYSGGNVLDTVAWTGNNSNDYLHPVGTKAPNELGICDMSGGVWEMIWDWFTGNPPTSLTTDPTGPAGPPNSLVHNRFGEDYQTTGEGFFTLKDSKGKFRRVERVGPHNFDTLTGFRVVSR